MSEKRCNWGTEREEREREKERRVGVNERTAHQLSSCRRATLLLSGLGCDRNSGEEGRERRTKRRRNEPPPPKLGEERRPKVPTKDGQGGEEDGN